MCPVEDVLSRQPDLKVLRDPPTLAGQRVRWVMMFRYDSEGAAVARCKVRAQAWTDPSLQSGGYPMNKEMSRFLASTIFDMARSDFEDGKPDEIRAGKVSSFWQQLLM